MGWWGKVACGAFGYLIGGPLGAVLGAALGHRLDKESGNNARPVHRSRPRGPDRQEHTQTAFFTATFSVMGHLCKSDGRVSANEIETARKVMSQMALLPPQKQAAMRLFTHGKQPGFPLDEVLWQLREEAGNRQNLLRMFVEIQLTAAYADGSLHPGKQKLLLHICNRLGITPSEYQRLETQARAGTHYTTEEKVPETRRDHTLAGAYAMLKIPTTATDEEIKKAYRRLLSQHHPDKLVAKGLPEEMVSIATRKTREIRHAYEQIREDRGFS